MGLFDKKYCDICGEKIGLLGNKKLDNGNCCKECAGKLSPWFSERRHSTVDDIKSQLEYRENNRAAVEAFHATRTLGYGMKVYLDEDNNKFLVTRAKNLAEANPDVLDFSQVTGCTLDLDESSTEEKQEIRRDDGTIERVSFRPPRYNYSYDLFLIIHVNHPYFDEIRFRINEYEIHINGVGNMMGRDPKNMSRDLEECYEIGEEIKSVLTNVREQVREAAISASMPKVAVTCPFCGATTMPDANGCCEYCGGALNA